MKDSELASMISRRKSVRSFLETPLPEETLSEIRAYANSVIPLFPGIKTAFRVLGREEIRSMTPLKAPHYLAFFSERDPDSDMNSGFMMEQIDLFFSAKGLGACWLGMAGPVEKTWQGLPDVIMLAFGTPEEDVHRVNSTVFKRKPLEDIASEGTLPDIMKAVRLAPSAMNKQPWYFCGDAQSCKAFSVPGTGFVNLADRWRFIDLGIALSFLFVSARAEGKQVSFRREDSTPCGTGKEYMLTCRLSD